MGMEGPFPAGRFTFEGIVFLLTCQKEASTACPTICGIQEQKQPDLQTFGYAWNASKVVEETRKYVSSGTKIECTRFTMSDVEAQPNGVSVEQTLAVVSHVLTDPEFAAEVRSQNEWVADLSDEQTAILFLASRYQWAVALLSLQTRTLKRELDGLATQLSDLESRLGR
jgi:hypothetical protein